ncbi:MAG: class I SAM-dependent methyltransferase [Rhodobacteraceae bacterium]|nr:class I SAM-dependent methyltransferase [Paracoccaceae bacterium]
MLFDWYLEIGCRSGKVFASVRGKTVAVDPFFRITQDVIGQKPALYIMQKTSDDFFESNFLKRCGIELSVTFIDGMHLFEYLLRDFMNAERHSKRDGVIVMHDCCPFSFEMCTRDLNNIPKGAWTGDVWKLIPILKAARPDLQIDVLNCKPTGLVVVSNLDPASEVLFQKYEDTVDKWRDVALEDFGLNAFYKLFEFQDGATFQTETSVFDAVSLDPASHEVPGYATP